MAAVYYSPVPENVPDKAPVRPEDGPQDEVEVKELAEFDELIGGAW